MKTAQQVNPGRLLVGLLLLVVGALLLLERAGWGDMGTLIGHWWPLIFVAAGLIQLGVGERLSAGPLIVAGFGLVMLIFTLDLVSASFWSVFWPLLLILVGLSFIVRRGFWPRAQALAADDVSALAVFGPNHVVSRSNAFHGGSATALFGGVTLDLRQARLAPGAAIDATVLFGGIDILVPQGWRVDVRGLPIFGGFDNKTTADGPLPEDAPVLTVSGMAAFGGIGIKHEK